MKKPGITGAASKRLQGPVGAQTASYLFTRIDRHHFDAQILCKTPISESAACGVSLQNCSCTSKNLDAKPPASGHRCGGQSLLDFMRWKQLESDGSLVFDCKIHQIPGISHLHVSSSCLQPNGQNSAVFIIPARQAAGSMSLKLETPPLRTLAADMIHSSPRDGVYANLDVAVWQVLKRIIDSVFHKRQACFVSKRGANSSSNPNMEEELNEPNMKCTCGLLDDS